MCKLNVFMLVTLFCGTLVHAAFFGEIKKIGKPFKDFGEAVIGIGGIAGNPVVDVGINAITHTNCVPRDKYNALLAEAKAADHNLRVQFAEEANGYLHNKQIEIDDKISEIRSLQNKISKIERENSNQTDTATRTHRQELEGKDRKINELTTKNNKQETELKELNSSLNNLKGEMKSKEDENQRIARDLQKKEDELRTANLTIENNNKDAGAEQGRLNQIISETQDVIKNKNMDIDDLNGKLDSKERELEKKEMELDTIKKIVSAKQLELDELNENLHSKQKELEEQKERTSEQELELGEIKEIVSKQQSDIEEKKSKLEENEKTLDKLKNLSDETQGKLEQNIIELKSKLETETYEFQKEKTKYETDLKLKTDQISKIQSKLTAADVKNKQHEQKIEDQSKTLQIKDQEIENLKKKQNNETSPAFPILFGLTAGVSLIAFIIICCKCQCKKQPATIKPIPITRSNFDEGEPSYTENSLTFYDNIFGKSITDIQIEEAQKKKKRKKSKKKKKKKRQQKFYSTWLDF